MSDEGKELKTGQENENGRDEESESLKNPEGILPRKITDEMSESYINYAMSVIAARALPDVRDGLKPVHRRILYSMNELNLDPTKAYKKSARIVGDTMGKYHPHGESSIYDAMVRMAQDFSMRYMLVDGHGNFGSMDGDGAAAQRYTEARLSRLATEMLADIEKDSVDFIPNYDGEFKEPVVMPARFPNLLVNGSSGIAVGMATNVPPHNLTEVIDALTLVIDNKLAEKETSIDELLAIIKGPDFPTGANIIGVSGIKQAYRTGRGKIIVRATANIESAGHHDAVIITELPYQINKAKLVEKMAELVRDKEVEGITDIRDESNRDGIRIVIDVKRDANANVILNRLYKKSQLQESFGVIMLALVDNEPKILNLPDILKHYLEHQKEVVTRRTRFDLNKAEKREHILQGLIIALDNIDEVIEIIRSSRDTALARARLSERFALSDEQAAAIVEMRLRSLTGLERERIDHELNEIKELIKELRIIIENEWRLLQVIREELLIVKAKYGDDRRTKIIPDESEFDIEDLITDECSVVTLSYLDYIKRLPLNTYKSQNRGGKGIIGMQMRDEDIVKYLFIANTHDYVLFFTNKGKVYQMRAYEIPESGRTSKGTAIINLLELAPGEKIAAVMPLREFDDSMVIMVTRNGIVKKTPLVLYAKRKKAGLIAINILDGDELITVLRTNGNNEIFLATRDGMGLRFNESGVRKVGRAATGVRGIKLRSDDAVVGAGILEEDSKLLLVSEKGFGKCTELNKITLMRRYNHGIRMYKVTERTGPVIGVAQVNDREELMMINSEGIIIRIRVADISTLGRVTQGVKLINLDDGVTVNCIAKIPEDSIIDVDEAEDGSDVESDLSTESGVDIESEADAESVANTKDEADAESDIND